MTNETFYSVIITFQIKAENLDAFIAATLANAHGTRTTEAGNIRFDFYQDKADPTRFTLVEVYRDEAARDEHFASAHFAVWKEATAEMFTGERAVLQQVALSVE
ncbi:MAG: antibiotic biosynthesis monooxygenase [Anaerolineae bacterium]|nr:antibiotic biosynthesis monooxygenase [Anaerolineae bacterium]